MLAVFFDYRGVMRSKFLPEDQTANKEYYLSVIRRLREQFDEKGCGKEILGFCTTIMGIRKGPLL
jgi:hypothetical protein